MTNEHLRELKSSLREKRNYYLKIEEDRENAIELRNDPVFISNLVRKYTLPERYQNVSDDWSLANALLQYLLMEIEKIKKEISYTAKEIEEWEIWIDWINKLSEDR